MKVTLFMAISLNGYIAEKDGGEDFLSHEHWDTLTELVKAHGNLIWGHGTYIAVGKWSGDYGLQSFPDAKKVIVSHNSSIKLGPGYEQVESPAQAIELLKNAGFENALLSGGSHLNSSFAKGNIIDEIILNIEPAILGTGIPLFAEDSFRLRLSLIETKNLGSIVQFRYKVNK